MRPGNRPDNERDPDPMEALGQFVPLILIFSFLHSLTLFLAVLVSFLAVPFLVYAIAERHWPILIASAVVLLITGSVAANALGIL